MREQSPTSRGGPRGLPIIGSGVHVGFILAVGGVFVGCVDTNSLFTEASTSEIAAEAPDPGPAEASSGPSPGSPEAAPDGEGATPSASEVGPPIDRVDVPPRAPSADLPPAANPADPGGPPEPAQPASSEPGPPQPPPPLPQPPPDPEPRVCPDLEQPLLLDFEQTGGATQAFFGDFLSIFSGGTFVYPERSAAAPDDAALTLGLASDVTGGDWHVSGLVGAPAGLGVFFDCESLDASRFDAIAFRIQGEIEGPAELTFFVGSAGNEVSRAWLVEQGNLDAGPSFGRCTPVAAQFDGSCQAARITLAITNEPEEVVVPFAALAGGSPEPGLNPAEITTLQWSLPPSTLGADGEPYAIDLRIDEIRFVDAE